MDYADYQNDTSEGIAVVRCSPVVEAGGLKTILQETSSWRI